MGGNSTICFKIHPSSSGALQPWLWFYTVVMERRPSEWGNVIAILLKATQQPCKQFFISPTFVIWGDETEKMTHRSGCPLPQKSNSWGRFWLRRKGVYSGVNIAGSCLQNHLSISGVLTRSYRGTVKRAELRNFWWCAGSQLCFQGVSLLSPACVIMQCHRSFSSSTEDVQEQDVQAVFCCSGELLTLVLFLWSCYRTDPGVVVNNILLPKGSSLSLWGSPLTY